MNLNKQLNVDTEKAEKGVWVEVLGCKWLLAYFGQSKISMYYTATLSKYQKEFDLETANVMANRQTLIEKILLGWDDVQDTDQDGNEYEVIYSKTEATRLLNTYENLDIMLLQASSKIRQYKSEAAKETLGKSKRRSPGKKKSAGARKESHGSKN